MCNKAFPTRKIIFGNNSNSQILTGSELNDELYGGNSTDTLNGSGGNDYLEGGLGNDALDGGADNDTLYGMAGEDSLLGNTGNDTLKGGQGNDTLTGGLDTDILEGGAGDDTYVFNTGDGNDSITDSQGTNQLTLNNQSNITLYRLAQQAHVYQDEHHNRYTELPTGLQINLAHNGGSLTLTDWSTVNHFGITIANEEITDTTEYLLVDSSYNGKYRYSFERDSNQQPLEYRDEGRTFTNQAGESVTIPFLEVPPNDEVVRFVFDGSNANDKLTGFDGDIVLHSTETLDGMAGNDWIQGRNGADQLIGGSGSDTLSGGQQNLYGDDGDDKLWGLAA